MGEENFTAIASQIGMGGVVAVFAIRETFRYLTEKKNGNGSDLKSIDQTLYKLSVAIETQTRILERVEMKTDRCGVRHRVID